MLLEYREVLLQAAFYGTLVGVMLWESVAEFRASQPRPLRRWTGNVGLGLLGSALDHWLTAAIGFGAALYAGHADFGLFRQLGVPLPLAIALTPLLLDLLTYWVHRAFHAVPVLWRLHCVHHSDTHFDFSLSLRNHPGEALLNALVLTPLLVVAGLPAEGVLLSQLLKSVAVVCHHANVHLPHRLDHFLRLLLVTPNMHQIHHSAMQAETDSNFSGVFSVWDRWFGTYCAAAAAPAHTMRFGLEYFREPAESRLDRLLLQPLRLPSLRPSAHQNW